MRKAVGGIFNLHCFLNMAKVNDCVMQSDLSVGLPVVFIGLKINCIIMLT